jgi:membrane-associated phospholipid phosphatase
MVFLIIYLDARLRLLRFRFFKTLVQTTALIAAFFTCISRISDYHHRFSDVLSGSALGIVIALYVTLVTGRVLWTLNLKPRRYEVGKAREDDETVYV